MGGRARETTSPSHSLHHHDIVTISLWHTRGRRLQYEPTALPHSGVGVGSIVSQDSPVFRCSHEMPQRKRHRYVLCLPIETDAS